MLWIKITCLNLKHCIWKIAVEPELGTSINCFGFGSNSVLKKIIYWFRVRFRFLRKLNKGAGKVLASIISKSFGPNTDIFNFGSKPWVEQLMWQWVKTAGLPQISVHVYQIHKHFCVFFTRCFYT